MKTPLLFDAHLDLAWNALDFNRDLRWTQEKIRRREVDLNDFVFRTRGTVCLPEMRRGRVGLCVATQIARMVPFFGRLPGYASQEQAWAATQGQLAWYREMEAGGEMVQIRDLPALDRHMALWESPDHAALPVGYILSLEGADSIVSMHHLEQSYADGLRALGPVHYGPGVYGHGTDDEGPLTARGHELLREMDRLGIILDATHLCTESFWDALKRFQGPVWASHSNCRVLSNWNRQFDDDQIKELINRDAVIGMAFDALMMVHGWTYRRSRPQDFDLKIEHICEHIDHICQLAGNTRHVGIGSDLDGGYGTEQTPLDLDSIVDLTRLSNLLLQRGFKPAEVESIFSGNFIRFLRQTWARSPQ